MEFMKWLAAVATVGIVMLLSVRKSYLRRRRRQLHLRRIRERQRELRAERNMAAEWPPGGTTIVIISSEDADPRHRDTIEVTQEWVNESLRNLSGKREEVRHEPDEVCSICLEEFEPETKLFISPECGHAFCLDCIGKWVYVQRDLACPNCKTPLCRNDKSNESPLVSLTRAHRPSAPSLPV